MQNRIQSVRRIIHYQRKPRAFGNFSVESIFADLRDRLSTLGITKVEAPCFSNGLVRRIAIMLHAWWKQQGVMHITGDITFAALLLWRHSTVVTILDCIGADRKGLSGYLYRKLWFEIPVLRAAVVTTISEYSKMDIVRYTACDPKKIVVTGVAIHSRYHPYPKSFDKDCPRMLQVGTAPNKNIERVAFALRGISCHLVIVGRLSESQEVALRENSIEFTCYDRLSDHELSEQYKSCDLVVFASTFEGFGMPILEANAIGRAVITGNCTSMPEVGGDAACFVDPFDVASIRAGVVKVCNDDGFRESLVANGYKNVERFNPDVVAERYLTVYESLPRFNQRDTSGAKL